MSICFSAIRYEKIPPREPAGKRENSIIMGVLNPIVMPNKATDLGKDEMNPCDLGSPVISSRLTK